MTFIASHCPSHLLPFYTYIHHPPPCISVGIHLQHIPPSVSLPVSSTSHPIFIVVPRLLPPRVGISSHPSHPLLPSSQLISLSHHLPPAYMPTTEAESGDNTLPLPPLSTRSHSRTQWPRSFASHLTSEIRRCVHGRTNERTRVIWSKDVGSLM